MGCSTLALSGRDALLCLAEALWLCSPALKQWPTGTISGRLWPRDKILQQLLSVLGLLAPLQPLAPSAGVFSSLGSSS